MAEKKFGVRETRDTKFGRFVPGVIYSIEAGNPQKSALLDGFKEAGILLSGAQVKKAREAAAERHVRDEAAGGSVAVVEGARDEAEKLIADAKAEAEKLIADAKAEAEKLIADAKAEAEKLIADAKAEAEKLIADAKGSIGKGEKTA